MRKIFLTLFSFILPFVANTEEILWWMVDDTATVDGREIMGFLSYYGEDDDNWNAARVKMTGADQSYVFLDVVWDGERFDGYEGIWIGDGGDGRWGTGYWGTQSPIDGLADELIQEAVFQIELGHVTYIEVLDAIEWVTLAETDPYSKEMLSAYIYERGTLWPGADFQWTPTQFHTVIPEPNADILVLIGASLIVLKRKTS